ncbi:MAG: hypothetical protein ACRENG_10925 [bacterium]
MTWNTLVEFFYVQQNVNNGLHRFRGLDWPKIRAISEIRCLLKTGFAILLLPAFLACQKKPTQTVDLGAVTLATDAAWQAVAPSSQMRKAQFTLPRVAEDGQDAELIVFYFGAGQGGSVEANLDRWYGQFAQPDSSSSAEKAKTSHEVVDGMNLTMVDLSGTYVAPKMPGSEEQYNEPSFRMLAAVLETAQGPYFFKLVGPEKTVAHWANSFSEFVKSAKKNAG